MTDPPHTSEPEPTSFGMWLLRQLDQMPSRAQYGTAKMRLWTILRELLSAYDVEPPSATHEEDMRAVLFGVHATARQAAEVPEWLRARLRSIEFTEKEIDEFLVVGYCIMSVYETLEMPPTCGRA